MTDELTAGHWNMKNGAWDTGTKKDIKPQTLSCLNGYSNFSYGICHACDSLNYCELGKTLSGLDFDKLSIRDRIIKYDWYPPGDVWTGKIYLSTDQFNEITAAFKEKKRLRLHPHDPNHFTAGCYNPKNDKWITDKATGEDNHQKPTQHGLTVGKYNNQTEEWET